MAKTLWLTDQLDDGTSGDVWQYGKPYTRLDGATANLVVKHLSEAIDSGGGGASGNSANTVTGPTAGQEVYDASISTGVLTFMSYPLSADFTIAGTITLNLWAAENSMNANVAINARVLRFAATTNELTEIAKSTRTAELGTSQAAANFTVTPTSTAFTAGDRIAVIVFGDDSTSNMASGFNFTFRYSGPTASAEGDSFITFTENLTFFSADPSGSDIYLTNTASAVSTGNVDLEMWTTPSESLQTAVTNTASNPSSPIEVTQTAGGTVVDWFTRPLTAMTLSGPVMVSPRGLESNAAANAAWLGQIALVNGDGSGAVVWGIGGPNSEIATSDSQLFPYWITGDDLAISNGQRLRFRALLQSQVMTSISTPNTMASGHTVTLNYNVSGVGPGSFKLKFSQTLTEFVAVERVPKFSPYPQLLPQ